MRAWQARRVFANWIANDVGFVIVCPFRIAARRFLIPRAAYEPSLVALPSIVCSSATADKQTTRKHLSVLCFLLRRGVVFRLGIYYELHVAQLQSANKY